MMAALYKKEESIEADYYKHSAAEEHNYFHGRDTQQKYILQKA